MLTKADAIRKAKEIYWTWEHNLSKGATRYGWPIVWDTNGRCYMYTPRENRLLHMDEDDNPHLTAITIALQLIEGKFDNYHHLGSTPYVAEFESATKVKARETLVKPPSDGGSKADKPNLVTNLRHQLRQVT